MRTSLDKHVTELASERDNASDCKSSVREFKSQSGNKTCLEIDQGIISMVIPSFPLIQDGQMLVRLMRSKTASEQV